MPSKHETLNQCQVISLRRWPSINPALGQCLVYYITYIDKFGIPEKTAVFRNECMAERWLGITMNTEWRHTNTPKTREQANIITVSV